MAYISKVRAREIVGDQGVAQRQVNAVSKKLVQAALKVKDLDRNDQIDAWEVGVAARQAKLNATAKTALFSAFGNAVALSDPDGRNNYVANGEEIAETVRGYGRVLRERRTEMRAQKFTPEVLQGKYLSNVEIRLLQAARQAR